MKKILFIIIVVALAACDPGANTKKPDLEDSTEGPQVAYDITPVWTYESDPVSGDFRMKKLRELTKEETSATTLVMIVNATSEKIHIDLVKVSNDTIYVAILDSKVLTHQLGSAGATQYMAAATYTLTEMTGIKYVNYDFAEGDHAEPGTYSRDNFSKGF